MSSVPNGNEFGGFGLQSSPCSGQHVFLYCCAIVNRHGCYQITHFVLLSLLVLARQTTEMCFASFLTVRYCRVN